MEGVGGISQRLDEAIAFSELKRRRNVRATSDLLPGRLLRGAGPPKTMEAFRGLQVDDARLSKVLSADAPLLTLYEGTIHGEGPAWQATHDRLVWSDVPNRRLLGWYPDGHVEVPCVSAPMPQIGESIACSEVRKAYHDDQARAGAHT